MRVLVAGGGTGGHFYPGYSAAAALCEKGAEVLFLLRTGDPAGRVLENENLPYVELELVGLPRSLNPVRQLRFAMKLCGALLAARRVIKDWRPDVVLGTGGYISFPALFWAALGGIPCMVHESNAKPGLANLLLSYMGAQVAAGLPVKGFPKKTAVTLTGTPIREFFSARPEQAAARRELGLAPAKTTVLAFGGSQGGRGLNLSLAKAAAMPVWEGIQILHITGKRDFEKISRNTKQPHVRLEAYCDRMDLAYAAADLVLCRSGASTVAELLALKKPAVLVPFPEAAADHQTENAKVLSTAGAAVLLPENPRLSEDLACAIPALARDAARLQAMRDAYSALSIPCPLESGKMLAEALSRLSKQQK